MYIVLHSTKLLLLLIVKKGKWLSHPYLDTNFIKEAPAYLKTYLSIKSVSPLFNILLNMYLITDMHGIGVSVLFLLTYCIALYKYLHLTLSI